MKQLDTTGVPLPFVCEYAIRVDDPVRIEQLLHDTFADHRERIIREFFRVSPPRVIAAMQLTGGAVATPQGDVVEDAESQRALTDALKRRENFNFEMVGIAPETEIYFLTNAADSPENRAIVVSKNRIRFNGEEMSLSAAAGQLLKARGMASTVAGPEYWHFDGESLADRRRRFESEG